MDRPCHYEIIDGERVFIPGCMSGAVHAGYDDIDEPMDFCICKRRPRFKKGDKQRIKRAEWRIERLKEKIAEIERRAGYR